MGCPRRDGTRTEDDETRTTCFDPPCYSTLDNPHDDDGPSEELRNNPVYRDYGKDYLG